MSEHDKLLQLLDAMAAESYRPYRAGWPKSELLNAAAAIRELQQQKFADLEKCCELVIAAGIPTGHADDVVMLVEEVLACVEELRRQR